MMLSIQITKFKFCQYKLRAYSPNLMLAKIIRYIQYISYGKCCLYYYCTWRLYTPVNVLLHWYKPSSMANHIAIVYLIDPYSVYMSKHLKCGQGRAGGRGQRKSPCLYNRNGREYVTRSVYL